MEHSDITVHILKQWNKHIMVGCIQYSTDSTAMHPCPTILLTITYVNKNLTFYTHTEETHRVVIKPIVTAVGKIQGIVTVL